MLDTRQPQLEMPRFEGDTFNRRHTGVGWEMGFPSCQLRRFQISTSPPSLSSQVRMISGFCAQIEFLPSKNKIPLFFFFSSKAINHICKTEQPFRAEKETSSQAAFPALSVTLSHRQLQFHSAIVFIRKTNFSAQLRLTSYVCSSIKSSSNGCTEFCAGLCSSVSSSVCCHWTASF